MSMQGPPVRVLRSWESVKFFKFQCSRCRIESEFYGLRLKAARMRARLRGWHFGWLRGALCPSCCKVTSLLGSTVKVAP